MSGLHMSLNYPYLLKENGMPEKCPDAALLSNLLEQQVDLPTLKGNTANSTSSD